MRVLKQAISLLKVLCRNVAKLVVRIVLPFIPYSFKKGKNFVSDTFSGLKNQICAVISTDIVLISSFSRRVRSGSGDIRV